MTVDELIDELQDASSDGMGDRDVIMPCQTGGHVSVTDVEKEEDDFVVRIS